MKNLLFKKIKSPFVLVKLKNNEFKLNESYFNDNQEIYYYYGEFKNIKIEKINLDIVKVGLSFFLQKNRVGISIFFNCFKKIKLFTLETVKSNNFNLNVKYFNIEKIIEVKKLQLNCRFFENEKTKKKEIVKISW